MTTTINNLVDVYKGHDIRNISDDFGPKFTISFAGQILTDRESVTAAREYIDQKTEREKGEGNLRSLGDNEMSKNQGMLITVYRGYDLREGPARFGVEIFRAGESVGYEVSIALAKSWIDAQAARSREEGLALADYFDKAVEEITARPTTPVSGASKAERKARNMKLMGRHENRPEDLI